MSRGKWLPGGLNFRGTKRTNLINFPLTEFDLSSYIKIKSSNTYDLYSVCNHYGNLLEGHYTSFCKHPYSKHWNRFDDRQVTIVEKKESICTPNACLLFYALKGL